MPAFGSISRRDLITALHSAGFEGLYSGGKHQFMVCDGLRVRIPNPHQGDISQNLLTRILKQAGLTEKNGKICSYTVLRSNLGNRFYFNGHSFKFWQLVTHRNTNYYPLF
jgi:predicted RNA binding protein YcfA (HicA-like mRNA interferase family)